MGISAVNGQDLIPTIAALSATRPTFGGDGSLGTVTVASNTNLAGVHNYQTLTINLAIIATVTLGRSLHIKCTGDLNLNGKVNGSNYVAGGAAGAAENPGGNGSSFEAGTVGGGGGGGGAYDHFGHGFAGGTSGGRAASSPFGSGGTSGGAAIAVTNPNPGSAGNSGNAAVPRPSTYATLYGDTDEAAAFAQFLRPGASGGGGGGTHINGAQPGNAGGVAGAGGNVLVIDVLGNFNIGGSGSATVSGGNGAPGANGTNVGGQPTDGGGGGGGGGAGAMLVRYSGDGSNAGTTALATVNPGLTAFGGSGGAGGAAGGTSGGITSYHGGAGSSGEDGFLRVIHVSA